MIKNKEKIIDLFKPNLLGFSNWIDISEIKKSSLPWTSNGNSRHNVLWNIPEFNWDIKRRNNKDNGKITSVRF